MNFEDAARFGTYISKSYSKDIFRLLKNYRDISASEAASRLGMHIQTVQDFLEAMADLGILSKKEAIERKRPYFRYTLKTQKISFEIDLNAELQRSNADHLGEVKIREKKNAGVRFSLARNGQYFSNVAIWVGKGRERTEKKINLTIAQGKFLYNLPFPDGGHMTLEEIRVKAGVENAQMPEIKDLVEELIQYKVIEVIG
ncbi:HVO_A0114 family putative DNA-binding protein [Maribellus mangrovi]|uniref:HVO_A0114 family putative DNA-binding protein n=1 Tax=Maribellus mangrovi TaxID=3133146 RepID=UPI0030EE2E61